MGVSQEHTNGFRMAVHHRFLARLVLDPNYSDAIILKFNLVMLGINFHGVVTAWLRHSAVAIVPSLDFVRWAQV